MSGTRIRHFTAFKALSPLSRPIADATHQIEGGGNDGINGVRL